MGRFRVLRRGSAKPSPATQHHIAVMAKSVGYLACSFFALACTYLGGGSQCIADYIPPSIGARYWS